MRRICIVIAICIIGFLGLTPKKDNIFINPMFKENRDLVNQAAPEFKLEDLNGEFVQLESLKGKVVILDFWATWCLPCIKSFPAMEMAMDRYKDDKEVVFLFINTWERAQDPHQLVKGFMEKRNLDFQVLMDVKGPGQTNHQVAESYNLKGIPAKFIIDRKGIIRNHVNGFTGNDQEVVDELAEMIESAREF